ncbi:MAG: hypothetical protein GFH27_549285n68 [Chloroflexi bacterium AL-W]|nr:hypothetical protein [Chloroflexi bacterium AL-N1]NOK65580.1 hypothetical protein [Chloroflexi bacterium AL-N10]NOK74479.1 hypothetical protein [Chloroflexi bacterium AL-N5]NOK80613.1 hypothetical protein [Chloroflexi bacterium AL-W]NOK88737.1 hypothetical protein [Chloroflexi bacterium AL-N15]
MTETAIKSNQREAVRLYERGVAAARGGQRRLAVVLLSRAVQFDPRHEQAWLWLSGVLDAPDEIAFCLQSVLKINPNNERARQGITWLERRNLGTVPTAPTTSNGHNIVPPIPAQPSTDITEPVAAPRWKNTLGKATGLVLRPKDYDDHHIRESWWVNWRRSHRDMGRAWLVVWSACIFMLLGTMALNMALRDAVQHNEEIAQRNAMDAQLAAQALAAPAEPMPEPILQTDVQRAQDADMLAFLSAIAEPREQLRQATEAYREATDQPGNSAIVHAAATRELRNQVELSREQIALANPPAVLEEAHTTYLSGLDQEVAALNDMLEFYGSFSVQLANRATLGMDEASRQLNQSSKAFSQQQKAARDKLIVPVQTIR